MLLARITAINERIAVAATRGFGTMWAFYVFTVYGLLPVAFPAAINTLLYWSNVVQLIALPLLAMGQTVLGRTAVDQAKETHDAVPEELALVRNLVTELHAAHVPAQTALAGGAG